MQNSRETLAGEARRWIEKAEGDLTAAVTVLKLGAACPTDVVCFHAQQCVEKYYKAVLVVNDVDFPKTHDLNALARLLPELLLPTLSDKERRRLTDYAVLSRYPGDPESIRFEEARRAVALARRVRKEMRRLLPRTATVRRKTTGTH